MEDRKSNGRNSVKSPGRFYKGTRNDKKAFEALLQIIAPFVWLVRKGDMKLV